MDEDFLHSDGPFAVPALWPENPVSIDDVQVALEPLPALKEEKAEWLETPAAIDDGPSDLESPRNVWTDEASASVIESIQDVPESVDEDDVWKVSANDIATTQQKPLKSWEQLGDQNFEEPCMYLSEAGPGAFDIVLRLCDPDEDSRLPVKPNIFLNCLFQLGLGRESVLFGFNKDGTLLSKLTEARYLGLSTAAMTSVVDSFGQCGYLFRAIRRMGSYVYRKDNFPPATVAFAQLSGLILLELERYVNARFPSGSLLQLHDSFKLPFKILTLLYDIFQAIRKFADDQSALSCLFEIGQEVERAELSLVPLIQEIISHASRTWLDSVESCVGLAEQDSTSKRLRNRLESSIDWAGTLSDEEMFDDAFPNFFGIRDRQLVMQIFQGMKVLEDQGISHDNQLLPRSARTLKWLFEWDAIVQSDNRRHDESSSIFVSTVDMPTAREHTGDDANAADDHLDTLQTSYSRIELVEEKRINPAQDSLVHAIQSALDASKAHERLTSQPSLELAAASSFTPVLVQRAQAVNRACLQELFYPESSGSFGESLSLTYHFNLIHRYLLLSHGMFAARLSNALFSTTLSTTERSSSYVRAGSLGLRLGSRSTWPPASSELQLALAGILAASFNEDEPARPTSRSVDLPGRLSFALRSLSDEEIEQCLDADGLEALDFLKISYTPPRPLDIVILPDALEKHDQIVKLLLRLQRLTFVVNHSFSSYRTRFSTKLETDEDERRFPVARRFAHAAYHLVTTVADYIRNEAIARPWSQFMASVTSLEQAVKAECEAEKAGIARTEGAHVDRQSAELSFLTADSSVESDTSTGLKKSSSQAPRVSPDYNISYLRQQHEAALSRILFNCLLRRRHDRVRALLDDVFRIVLRFAAVKAEQEEQDLRQLQRHKQARAAYNVDVDVDQDEDEDEHSNKHRNRNGDRARVPERQKDTTKWHRPQAEFDQDVEDQAATERRVEEIGALYARFRRQVTLFVQVCRGLMERGEFNAEGPGLASGSGSGEGLSGLLARLTLTDFYVDRGVR